LLLRAKDLLTGVEPMKKRVRANNRRKRKAVAERKQARARAALRAIAEEAAFHAVLARYRDERSFLIEASSTPCSRMTMTVATRHSCSPSISSKAMRKPLKLGIHDDLLARESQSERAFRRAYRAVNPLLAASFQSSDSGNE
jgi:hypothetical protein